MTIPLLKSLNGNSPPYLLARNIERPEKDDDLNNVEHKRSENDHFSGNWIRKEERRSYTILAPFRNNNSFPDRPRVKRNKSLQVSRA